MLSANSKVYEAARDDAYVDLSAALIRMSSSDRHTALETKIQDGDHLVTPLLIAAYNGNLRAMKILLRYDADIEARGTVKIGDQVINGCTPLWVAAATGHLDVVKLLIERNAEVDGRTSTNSTPLRAAAHEGHHDIVRCLVENGADVNARTVFDSTPLMIACYKGHVPVVSYLVAHGADIKLQDRTSDSALHYAAQNGQIEIVDDLLALGGLQSPNNNRLTPLLFASNKCKIEMVEHLIKDPQCTKQQRIEALELLGATIANDSDANCDTRKAFFYMKRGMEERFQDLSHPLFKQHMQPIEAYENRMESQNLKELALIEGNDHAIYMEGLIIRERILGPDNIELHHPIKYRGAFFADARNFSSCIGLWKHALEISCHCGSEKITEDLSYLGGIFCEMIEKNCLPGQKDIEEVFEKLIGEYERLSEQLMQSSNLKGANEVRLLQEKLETLVVISLHLMTIFTNIQDMRKEESSTAVMSSLIQRFLLFNPCSQNGNTLLHLSVCCKSLTDFRYVQNVCKFPCAKTLKLIIDAGGNVNAVNDEGNTTWHLAVAFKPTNDGDLQVLRDVLKALLDGGINKDMVNNDGKTALDVAETDEARRILTIKNRMK